MQIKTCKLIIIIYLITYAFNVITIYTKTPLWLQLTNQILYNEYQLKKSYLKNQIKANLIHNSQLNRVYNYYLIKYVDNCLQNNYYLKCEFNSLNKYLKYLCVFEFTSQNSNYAYKRYCLLINVIKLINYCDQNVAMPNIEQRICKLDSIKHFIELFISNCNLIDENDTIYVKYCQFFIDNSLNFLLKLLIILHTNDYENSNYFYKTDVYKFIVSLMKLYLKFFYSNGYGNDFEYKILWEKMNNIILNQRKLIIKQLIN